MAGGRGGLDAAACEQQRQSDAHEAEGRLRILGESQLVFVGADEQVAKVHSCEARAAFAKVGDLRIGEELGAHPRVLRALARK
jgi:hypothetical protein